MSFPITTLIALFAYLASRLALTSSKQVFIGLFIALLVIVGFTIPSNGTTILSLHMTATSFSIVLLIITFVETSLLERHIIKVKRGEIGSNTKSVEREYNEIFALIGCGLAGIVLSLTSGLLVIGELNIELIFKIVLTAVALIIYMLTFLGIKYLHLRVRNAVRGTILAFAMVLLAYFGNSIILINYL